MNPLLGFAPDADQTTLGVLSNVSNLIPSRRGMKGAPSFMTPPDTPALSDPCLGAAVVYKLDGTRRTLAGTEDAIYELSSGSWSDVSDTGGYSGGSDTRWSITQFGDATLMANAADGIQRSTSGAFAAISGAPSAKIIFSVGSFVMALNVNDGAVKPDGWHCCAAFDDTDWTESSATQSNSGRLVATAGAVMAGGRLGEYAVAYKQQSVYLGQYVGAPAVWDWILMQGGDAGCVGQEAWCDMGNAHFFVGIDNFYLLTPSEVIPLGDGTVKEWFSSNANQSFLYRTKCVYDRDSNLVWVFYPSTGTDQCDSALVYNVQTKKWGRASMTVQATLQYVSPGFTINGLATLSSTISGLPAISYDSPFWNAGSRALSVVDGSNQIQNLSGPCVSSSLTTGDVGDDDMVSMLKGIRLRYANAPTSATVQTYISMNSGMPYSTAHSGAMNDGKFDVRCSARWHKARVDFSGDVEATGMNAEFASAGRR